jgi:hypothetical protein
MWVLLRSAPVVVPLNLLAFLFAYWGIEIRVDDEPSLREGGPYVVPFAVTTVAMMPTYFTYRRFIATHPLLDAQKRRRWLRTVRVFPPAIVATWWALVRNGRAEDLPDPTVRHD